MQYYGQILNTPDANNYTNRLLNEIAWQNDEAIIFGKHIITKRKVAWYGDKQYTYTYSKITKSALIFTPLLLQLKTYVEDISNAHYNSCLLNLYHNGAEGMAWHSDEEKDLIRNGAIASLSFGAERFFALKHKKTQEKRKILLKHGSLLVMAGTTQSHWLHHLPLAKNINTPRINLTFRTIKKD